MLFFPREISTFLATYPKEHLKSIQLIVINPSKETGRWETKHFIRMAQSKKNWFLFIVSLPTRFSSGFKKCGRFHWGGYFLFLVNSYCPWVSEQNYQIYIFKNRISVPCPKTILCLSLRLCSPLPSSLA